MQILVCEERPEYIAMQSKKTLEALQRRPFEVMVICNPRLTPVGRKGYRYWEGCLSVAGYQVTPSTHRLLLQSSPALAWQPPNLTGNTFRSQIQKDFSPLLVKHLTMCLILLPPPPPPPPLE